MKLRVNSFNLNFKYPSYPIAAFIICVNYGMFLPEDFDSIEYLIDLLNINKDELIKILSLYNVKFYNNLYYFSNKEDAQRCLESLELLPYLMMLELSEEIN